MERFRVPDIPDGAAFQDLPPTYNEAVTSHVAIKKDGDVDDDDEGEHDTETDQPPRYSQLNLHLA